MIPFSIVVPQETKNRDLFVWTFRTAILALNLRHVIVSSAEDPAFETLHLPVEINQSHLSLFDSETFDPGAFSFSNEGVIINRGYEDELFTAFYLINCLQETNSTAVDHLGRFTFKGSYQDRFKNIEVNFVTLLFERYFKKHFSPALRNQTLENSSFFFSHDIDSLYGALLQDGLAALKNGRLDVITKLILNTVFLKPEWFNIDKILKIDSEYDLRSTFFWIVNKGRVNKSTTNADYKIRSKKIQDTLTMIREKGNYLGLHKSISEESFDEERKKLPFPVIVNRNHYLRFNLPEHFDNLERSSFKIDCSLGFAEHYGFRNSLAIPFVPINVQIKKPYHFIEVPLNVMDGTFQKYMQVPHEQISRKMIEFIEKNKFNSVLSVLWHNHFFSSYRFRGYFEPYLELLDYLRSKQFRAVGPDQLYNNYFFTL